MAPPTRPKRSAEPARRKAARPKTAGTKKPRPARRLPAAAERRAFDDAVRAFRLKQWRLAARLFKRVMALHGPLAAKARQYLLRIPAGGKPSSKRPTARRKVPPDVRRRGYGRKAAVRVERRRRKPAPAPTIVRRTPHMDLVPDAAPAPGATFFVDVYADTVAHRRGEESEPIVLRGRPGQTRFEVDVWLAGSAHFQIAEPKAAILALDAATRVSTRARFTVSVGVGPAGEPAILAAYFFYNGRPCGKVTRRVTIDGLAAAGPPDIQAGIDGSLALDASAVPPDLTVEITDPTRNRRALQCRVTTRLIAAGEQPPVTDWFLPDESPALVGQFMQEFVKPGISNRARVLSLKGAGFALFEAAPPAFQDTLWRLIDAGTPPRSILITSEEPYIPWELMIPRRRRADGTREEREPLGVEFAVGRWVHEAYLPPPQRLPLIDSFVVAPEYPGPRPKPLPYAAEETTLVLATVPGEAIVPADLRSIDDRVQAGRSLLHFICHGADSPGVGVQVIYLAGGIETLSSLQLPALEGMAAAARRKPLVFLNACEVGRPSAALVGIGGFAKAFVDMGAAGVIAPLWSVRDTIAFDVARRFYEAIARRPAASFADILRTIRKLAYDVETGEDTYAAYCFYGDPAAKE
jgi:hypothetical protein